MIILNHNLSSESEREREGERARDNVAVAACHMKIAAPLSTEKPRVRVQLRLGFAFGARSQADMLSENLLKLSANCERGNIQKLIEFCAPKKVPRVGKLGGGRLKTTPRIPCFSWEHN